jgi:hypothetical protein
MVIGKIDCQLKRARIHLITSEQKGSRLAIEKGVLQNSLATKKYETLFPVINCAQIVPVKVKFFQTDPNKTKNDFQKRNRINVL